MIIIILTINNTIIIINFLVDPFTLSLKTSRKEHAQRMEASLKPALKARLETLQSADYRRGYRHAPEYGTFCNFRKILLKNESSMLKR